MSTQNFGVVGVHSHIALAPGQVMFQGGNSTFTHQEIKVYDDVKDTGVPYTYRITTDAEPQLLPLDLGDITSGVLAARNDLATAMAGGNFLNGNNIYCIFPLYKFKLTGMCSEFAEAASGNLAGIAYIRPLDRTALEHSEIVKNHVCPGLDPFEFTFIIL